MFPGPGETRVKVLKGQLPSEGYFLLEHSPPKKRKKVPSLTWQKELKCKGSEKLSSRVQAQKGAKALPSTPCPFARVLTSF